MPTPDRDGERASPRRASSHGSDGAGAPGTVPGGSARLPLDRRRLLALSAAGLGAGLGGCGGTDDGTPPGGDPSEGPTSSTPSAPAAPTIGATTATPPATTTQPPTEPPRTTRPWTTVPYEPELVSAPTSAISPTDGFADAAWLDQVDPEIVRVTNLNRKGPGSFHDAVVREGPRIVVFEVGGVIDQETWGLDMKHEHGNCFVAGQTAPPPGITVVKGYVPVSAPNVIFQHVRIRPGEGVVSAVDSMTAGHGSKNVVFDHCSVSWSIDENMSTAGSEANHSITFSNNLIAEALRDSVHPKGPHSMGSLILNNSADVAVLGNVYASNENRNPRLKGGTESVVANNLVYNFDRGVMTGGEGAHPTETALVGNHYVAGPATDTGDPVVFPRDDTGTPKVHLADNRTTPASMPMHDGRLDRRDEPLHWPGEGADAFEPIPANRVREHALRTAGARPADRSPHDLRIVRGVRDGTSRLVDSEQAVGGYPDLERTERALDPPPWGDGFTEWLYRHTRAVTVPDATAPD